MDDQALGSVEFCADLGFKAVDEDVAAQFADQLDEGDFLIHGWGANFQVDRQNEAFTEGAFERGLKTFVERGGPLCHHHKKSAVLGKVLAAEIVPGQGVKLTARVDRQPESSPLRGVYEQIKKGTLSSLSAGGFFRRIMTPAGPRINDVDLVEWSVTGTPVGKGDVSFAVLGAKALEDLKIPDVPAIDGDIREEDLSQIGYLVDDLTRVFDRISKRGGGSAAATDTQSNPVG